MVYSENRFYLLEDESWYTQLHYLDLVHTIN